MYNGLNGLVGMYRLYINHKISCYTLRGDTARFLRFISYYTKGRVIYLNPRLSCNDISYAIHGFTSTFILVKVITAGIRQNMLSGGVIGRA